MEALARIATLEHKDCLSWFQGIFRDDDPEDARIPSLLSLFTEVRVQRVYKKERRLRESVLAGMSEEAYDAACNGLADATARLWKTPALVELYAEAAGRGILPAITAHAYVHFLTGYGVPIDWKKAFGLFYQAARLGHAEAQCCLGAMYMTAQGVRQSNKACRYWMSRGCEQGHIYSCSLMFWFGWGAGVNPMAAQACLEIAAARDHPMATSDLAACKHMQSIDVERCIPLYSRAVSMGVSWARNWLGNVVRDGVATKADPVVALALYQESIEYGSTPAAVTNISWMMDNLASKDAAFALNREAAEQNYVLAMFELAKRYYEIDKLRAMYWLQQTLLEDYKPATPVYEEWVRENPKLRIRRAVPPWSVQRVLWIAHYRERHAKCPMGWIARDSLKLILEFASPEMCILEGDLLWNHARQLDPKVSFSANTSIGTSIAMKQAVN